MNIYVKYLKPLLFAFISLLILTFVFTFFNYINFINGTLFNIIKILIPFISLFIGSFLIGKQEKEKGYLNGLIIGIVFIILLLIINLIFKNEVSILYLIINLIYIMISIIGGIIGVNINKSSD